MEAQKRVLDAIALHKKLLGEFEAECLEAMEQAAKLLIDCVRGGGCVYICGNGGSAADAQHIAGEFVGRFLRERKALAAVALTTDTSVMTSVANDYDFEQVFSRQAEALVKTGDVLWAISTSGTSKNVLAAVEVAKEKGAKVLAFTGKKDSPLERLSDCCICVEYPKSFAVQEIHQIAYHILCDLVEEAFAGG